MNGEAMRAVQEGAIQKGRKGREDGAGWRLR